MSNLLVNENSPYLLQHSENPVNWYPWGDEAFTKAKAEDKPIFLSIGYSTCHWCHVMARESFEDDTIAEILNKYFVSIKVDKEERPDIDSIYMSVCQAVTGSGGWPMSIFLTSDKKPFFAGTYFPKSARNGAFGFEQLLLAIQDKWKNDRSVLLNNSVEIVRVLSEESTNTTKPNDTLIVKAKELFSRSFDSKNGGFGDAPKFPTPHNLLFLLQEYAKRGDEKCLMMAEKTLTAMYKGGMFDHIGYGFCRYSTDRAYLVPHFEKMLYDNALLILAYCKAYEMTKNEFYLTVAKQTAEYVMSELADSSGGFFCAQDADSDGVEGGYYVFTPQEIIYLLGQDEGAEFCKYYGITQEGNFEGKSIPNLLHTDDISDRFAKSLPKLREYRKNRAELRTDDKILASWNSLMISALCTLYRVSHDSKYLDAAEMAQAFIEQNLCDGDVLFVSFRNGKHGIAGFLDDYAGYAYSLLVLYDVTLNKRYLDRAKEMVNKAVADFFDRKNGGFFLNGSNNETLPLRPKESYDGAIPSGNSLMTYNLVRINLLSGKYSDIIEKQLYYMCGEAQKYPAGYCMFLCALSDYLEPPTIVTVVKGENDVSKIPLKIASDTIVKVLYAPSDGYSLLNNDTTYYVCKSKTCMPPENETEFINKYGLR